jgi:hypothetical protein
MFKKLVFAMAGLTVAVTAFLAAGTAGTVSAEEPLPPPYLVCPGAPGDHGPYDHPWLRRSIVESAAEVMNVPVYVVYQGLADGQSLAQIAAGYGIGEERLEAGILYDEAGDLHRRVHQGFITHAEARLIWNWLNWHIDEIVNRHFPCFAEAVG